MKITVVGAGYVGLVAAACLAEAGHSVVVVERCPDRRAQISSGRSPFYEPDLEPLLALVLRAGSLRVISRLGEAPVAQIVLIAVGTPSAPSGAVDTRDVEAALVEAAVALSTPALLVLKSTVPPGSSARLAALVHEASPIGHTLVFNPEFLREGSAVADFKHPERVVLGSRDPDAIDTLERMYAPFAQNERVLVMDPESAGLTKYASNAMLAARLTLMNELAPLCAAIGADLGHVQRGVGSDPRIGPHYLEPSLGYGGSCLPKDVSGLIHALQSHGLAPWMLEAVRDVNTNLPRRLVEQIRVTLGSLRGARIAVWGVAFKAGTDDVRESTAVGLCRQLRDQGAFLQIHDPEALQNARVALGAEQIRWCTDPYDALARAEALVVCTEWAGYRGVEAAELARRMAGHVVFDTRGVFGPRALEAAGLSRVGPGQLPDPWSPSVGSASSTPLPDRSPAPVVS